MGDLFSTAPPPVHPSPELPPLAAPASVSAFSITATLMPLQNEGNALAEAKDGDRNHLTASSLATERPTTPPPITTYSEQC